MVKSKLWCQVDLGLNPASVWPQASHLNSSSLSFLEYRTGIDSSYYAIHLWWGLGETTFLKYLSQVLAHYICTEKSWWCLWLLLVLCHEILPCLFNGKPAFWMWREHLVPHTEWFHQLTSHSLELPLPHYNRELLLPAQRATIKWAQLSGSIGHSLVEPSLGLYRLTLPSHPTPQGPESFDAHMVAWQERKNKTLLVPAIHNKTFGNLEGNRDKRLDFFFFLFISPPKTNGGLSLLAAPSEPHQHQRAWNQQKAKAGEFYPTH